MTTTKRALTLAAVTAAASAIALVPATAQAHHVQPQQDEVTSVLGHANFTQLPTHDQVAIGARGNSDDGFGVYRIRNDQGSAVARVLCVTGSRAERGFTDAAVGLHITRSTIADLPRGTDAIEYIRDGGRRHADASGLVTGTANCPAAGFTVPDGVLVQVPDQRDNRGDNGNGRFDRNGRFDNRYFNRSVSFYRHHDRFYRHGERFYRHSDRFDRGRDGYQVQIQH